MCFEPLPVIINPPMATLFPVPTSNRVDRFWAWVIGVGVLVGVGVGVGDDVGDGLEVGVGDGLGVAVGVGGVVGLGLGVGIGPDSTQYMPPVL